MAQDIEKGRELMEQAIKSEVDGQRFYNYLADRTSNGDAKRKLKNLAADEVRHEKALREMYEKIYGSKLTELPQKGVGVLSQFFDNPEKHKDLSEVRYIDLAIEAELAATQYYKQQAKETDSDEFSLIYKSMAAEEFSHYELLKAEKDALGGNYYWFSFDSTSPMED